MTTTKRPWYEFKPQDMVDTSLPHPDIQGPYTQEGEECPWPWEPAQLVGVPLGQYHCGYCGEMVVAGMEHVDYGPIGPDGLNDAGREFIKYMEQEKNASETE